MSTTVIPHGADGVWRMSTIAPEAAAELAQGTHWTSAVGHASSAQAMAAALGVDVHANRLTVTPTAGDAFLCMRLHQRPPEGAILNLEQLEALGYSWALLEYEG